MKKHGKIANRGERERQKFNELYDWLMNAPVMMYDSNANKLIQAR